MDDREGVLEFFVLFVLFGCISWLLCKDVLLYHIGLAKIGIYEEFMDTLDEVRRILRNIL